MDNLPDELLLRVLSKIEDGYTLLKAVPLVCKRWHALHMEPEAWSSVRLEHYPDNHDDRAREDAALLLARAPYMHCLSTGALGDERMYEALRRSSLVIRSARFDLKDIPTFQDFGPILDLLYRSRHTVRAVDVGADDVLYMIAKDRSGRNLIEVLSALHNLEVLILRGIWDLSYDPELAQGQGLCILRRLEVLNDLNRAFLQLREPAHEALIASIARSSCKTLRELIIAPVTFMSAVGADALQDLCLEQAAACERLESLEVRVRVNDFFIGTKVVHYVRALLGLCHGLADSLRRVAIVLDERIQNERMHYGGLVTLAQEKAAELKRAKPKLGVTLSCIQGEPRQTKVLFCS